MMIDTFTQHDVDCVGGILKTVPANTSKTARAISIALSHPFGIGNAHFRIGVKEPRLVDTVAFGCYPKETFQKFGFFDEDLVRNQDDEFNMRIVKKGGKILLHPDIVTVYHARDSIGKLCRMYFQYGYFKPLVARKVGSIVTLRQLMPTALVASLSILGLLSIFMPLARWPFAALLCLYFGTNLLVSLLISAKEDLSLFFLLPFVFSAVHFSYGFGYLKGVFDFVLLKRYEGTRIEDVPMTR
jgi:hypothetical protein